MGDFAAVIAQKKRRGKVAYGACRLWCVCHIKGSLNLWLNGWIDLQLRVGSDLTHGFAARVRQASVSGLNLFSGKVLALVAGENAKDIQPFMAVSNLGSDGLDCDIVLTNRRCDQGIKSSRERNYRKVY
jgi:hypothetical protein